MRSREFLDEQRRFLNSHAAARDVRHRLLQSDNCTDFYPFCPTVMKRTRRETDFGCSFLDVIFLPMASASDLSARDGSTLGFVSGFVRHVKFPCRRRCQACWIGGRWSVKRAFAPLNSIHGGSRGGGRAKCEQVEEGDGNWTMSRGSGTRDPNTFLLQSKHAVVEVLVSFSLPFPPCAHLHIPSLLLLLHSES